MRIAFFAACCLLVFSCNTDNTSTTAPGASQDSVALSQPDMAEKIQANNALIGSGTDPDSLFFLASQQVTLCEEYSKKFKTDPMVPRYLDYGGRAAKAGGQFEKAVSLYNQVINGYADYDSLPYVMFDKAFILDEHLKRPDDAKKEYNTLMTKFPSHPLSKEAEQLLSILYMSDEELIKKFQEQNKK